MSENVDRHLAREPLKRIGVRVHVAVDSEAVRQASRERVYEAAVRKRDRVQRPDTMGKSAREGVRQLAPE